jgi:hypothetical protein
MNACMLALLTECMGSYSRARSSFAHKYSNCFSYSVLTVVPMVSSVNCTHDMNRYTHTHMHRHARCGTWRTRAIAVNSVAPREGLAWLAMTHNNTTTSATTKLHFAQWLTSVRQHASSSLHAFASPLTLTTSPLGPPQIILYLCSASC